MIAFGEYADDDIASTMKQRDFKDATDLVVTRSVAVLPFNTTKITSPSNGANPKWGDPCFSLAAGNHPPAVAVALRGRDGGATAELGDDVMGTLRASGGGGGASRITAAIGLIKKVSPQYVYSTN